MAVKMQINVTLEELGAAADRIDEVAALVAAGAVVVYYPKEAHIMKMGSTLSKAYINTSALPMYVAGKMGAGSFSLINGKVVDWIEQAYAALGLHHEPKDFSDALAKVVDSVAKTMSEAEVVAAINSPAALKNAVKANVKAKAAPSVEFVGKISTAAMAMSKVPLSQATQVYQPVNGSDSDSRYFAVALSEGVKVGVRLKGAKVSFRVEGPRVASDAKFRSHLSEVGLSVQGSYASVHLSASPELMMKAVGALLMSLNHPFNVVATDLHPINNKGN